MSLPRVAPSPTRYFVNVIVVGGAKAGAGAALAPVAVIPGALVGVLPAEWPATGIDEPVTSTTGRG